MPYRCTNCGLNFDEPAIIHTSYESYYGVRGLFPNSTPLDLEVCPICEDNNLEEVEEDEESEDE